MDLLEYLLLPVMGRIERLERKIMSALEDLTGAVNNLTAQEAKFLTDIAGMLTGGSVSDEQAEALAATINQRAADLTAADPVPVPPPVVPSDPGA